LSGPAHKGPRLQPECDSRQPASQVKRLEPTARSSSFVTLGMRISSVIAVGFYPANVFLPAALAFAHRALAAAASRARALALTFLARFVAGFPLRFAHRAFCAAAILALAGVGRLCSYGISGGSSGQRCHKDV